MQLRNPDDRFADLLAELIGTGIISKAIRRANLSRVKRSF